MDEHTHVGGGPPDALAVPTVVTIPWLEYRALVADAGHWRLFATSPHVAELLAEWDRRRATRDTSNAVAAAADWRAIASAPTYAELAARRAVATTDPLTPDQIRARTSESWARVQDWITARRTAA
ncbi:hypothetical protein [Amycolatopsis vastitatis]|uniref:Uncharacterized protein n=1 Tax=Amycolatopsis vastitatis TaxID=1905142 RepID=A0A229TDK7_9PSEU|nr:hypothetical protein [Amycolatopsis vastitatis]OXM69342.1 hypothetical protein CF165_07360 [Amycolatopsis vastitatis]